MKTPSAVLEPVASRRVVEDDGVWRGGETPAVVGAPFVRVMDLLEYIPAHTQEREICEMIYIDCMSVPSVAESIPMSKSQVYRYRNQGLDIILQNPRVQQIIEEHEAEYKVYVGNLKN